MKLGCEQCGTYEEHTPCPSCGQTQHIGDDYRCPHLPAFKHKGFEPYYDWGLGQHVTGVGDINAACRPKWEGDHITQIQPRDKGEHYYRELNEKREARRAGR